MHSKIAIKPKLRKSHISFSTNHWNIFAFFKWNFSVINWHYKYFFSLCWNLNTFCFFFTLLTYVEYPIQTSKISPLKRIFICHCFYMYEIQFRYNSMLVPKLKVLNTLHRLSRIVSYLIVGFAKLSLILAWQLEHARYSWISLYASDLTWHLFQIL